MGRRSVGSAALPEDLRIVGRARRRGGGRRRLRPLRLRGGGPALLLVPVGGRAVVIPRLAPVWRRLAHSAAQARNRLPRSFGRRPSKTAGGHVAGWRRIPVKAAVSPAAIHDAVRLRRRPVGRTRRPWPRRLLLHLLRLLTCSLRLRKCTAATTTTLRLRVGRAAWPAVRRRDGPIALCRLRRLACADRLHCRRRRRRVPTAGRAAAYCVSRAIT